MRHLLLLAGLFSGLLSTLEPTGAATTPAPVGQTLLNPPAWVFALPPRVLGTLTSVHGLLLIQPRGMDTSSVALYTWSIRPSINAALSRDYLAQQAVRGGCVGPGTGCAPGMPRPTIVRYPAGGWLYGRYTPAAGASPTGPGNYAYSAGAVFHNLVFKVEAWCHLPRTSGTDACQAWTAGTLEHLLGRARGYAASHPRGDRVPPAP